jgi:hypothetical protein
VTGCGPASHHGQVDVASFVRDGFVAVRQAVDTGTAAACRELIWQSMARRGLRRSDPATWPPLVRVEASYRGPGGQGWRANVRSRARGLLALFLLTDVGPDDAPTRLVCGPHLTVARFLAPYGEAGTDTDADLWYPSTLCRTVSHATGAAGDVFLCHPFIVHTATWPHRGTGPRMIAQPAVSAPAGFTLDGTDPSPVAQAITSGLAMTD